MCLTMELDRRRPYFCAALVVRTGEPCKSRVRCHGGRCGTHRGKPHHLETKFEPFECSVCFEMCNAKEFAQVTTCGHRFHRKCIDAYRAHLSRDDWNCPTCRATQRDPGRGDSTQSSRASRACVLHAMNGLVDEDVAQDVMRVFFGAS